MQSILEHSALSGSKISYFLHNSTLSALNNLTTLQRYSVSRCKASVYNLVPHMSKIHCAKEQKQIVFINDTEMLNNVCSFSNGEMKKTVCLYLVKKEKNIKLYIELVKNL